MNAPRAVLTAILGRLGLAAPLLFLALAWLPVRAVAGGLALVYDGPGSVEDSPQAMADAIKSVGLEARFFSSPAELPALLGQARLVAVGGTDNDTRKLLESFPEPVIEAIRRFVAGGGRYCGICGGAYLAARQWEEGGEVRGFDLAPVEPDNHFDDPTPMLVPIVWRDQTRQMYYQLGPEFRILPGEGAPKVLARYEDGAVAALVCAYGSGKVLLSGPHPEAPRSWIEDDGLPVASWRSSLDLLQAALRDLLSEKPPGE